MRPNDELLQKIGQLRSKWKAFVWLRGLVWVLGAIVASVALGIYLAASPSVPFATVRMLSLFFLAGVVIERLSVPTVAYSDGRIPPAQDSIATPTSSLPVKMFNHGWTPIDTDSEEASATRGLLSVSIRSR